MTQGTPRTGRAPMIVLPPSAAKAPVEGLEAGGFAAAILSRINLGAVQRRRMITARYGTTETRRAMPAYRCFAIDRSGHIAAADVVYGADDDAATRAACRVLEQHRAARCLEIWRLDRRVGVVRRELAVK